MAKVEKKREKFYTNGNFPFFPVVALFITVPTHSEKGLKPLNYNYMFSILLKLPMPRPLWRPLLVNSVKYRPSDTARSQIMPWKPFDNLD